MSRVRGEGSPEVGGSTVLGRTRVMKRGPREAAGCPQGTGTSRQRQALAALTLRLVAFLTGAIQRDAVSLVRAVSFLDSRLERESHPLLKIRATC